jgi:hypothetical protein
LGRRETFLFKIAIQRASLWHSHVYMYYIPNLFISPTFLFSTLVVFLWWVQQVQKFYIHSRIESISSIFTFFISLLYPPPPFSVLPLAWPVFHSCPSFLRCLLISEIFACTHIVRKSM